VRGRKLGAGVPCRVSARLGEGDAGSSLVGRRAGKRMLFDPGGIAAVQCYEDFVRDFWR